MDGLPATWFDPSFDPGSAPAIPFSIAWNGDSVPRASKLGSPRPIPVYVPADAVAVYAPWHIYGVDYGAYLRQEKILGLAGRMAEDLGCHIEAIAPHVLRQIVLHEQAHFMFEVAAGELEDVRGNWLYREYARSGSGPWPPLTGGVVEEIWASWRELKYAERVERKHRPDLSGYSTLIKRELETLPPGYSEYHLMADLSAEVRAAVASLILGGGGPGAATGRWGGPTGTEANNMPIYWLGDEEILTGLGGKPRVASPPSIRRFEKWLRKIGADVVPSGGKGSHRKVILPNGRTEGYGTTHDGLTRKDAKRIARELGLPGPHILFELVRDMRVLPT